MAVSLSKGGNVSLKKAAPDIAKAVIGLGWDERVTTGAEFDLDASLFMVGANGKVVSDGHFIFYNNDKSPCGSVQHMGDNRTGSGDGDDEEIKVDLNQIPANVERVVITVTIHDAEQRSQNFGQVSNAYVRLVDEANGVEAVRYDLTEDYSTETAMVMAELYRHNGDWKMRAIGQGFADGLRAMCIEYGVQIG